MSTRELAIVTQGPVSYEFSSGFDGQRYYLQFDYNRRNDTWYMDLKDADRVTVLAGLACLTNVELLIGRFALDDTFVFGDILIADSVAARLNPSYDNFGDVVSAFYTSVVS